MDLSKLSSNDKIAAIGAVAAIVGALLSFGGGGSFGLLTGIVMLVIVFLPQFSPSTKLPGSKGSLMLIVGGVAGVAALLSLLAILPYLGLIGGYFFGLLLSIVGGLLMGWASWREFQSEGGKFTIGTASAPAASSPPAPPTQQAVAAPPPPAAPMSPPAAPMSPGQTVTPAPPIGSTDQSDEDRS